MTNEKSAEEGAGYRDLAFVRTKELDAAHAALRALLAIEDAAWWRSNDVRREARERAEAVLRGESPAEEGDAWADIDALQKQVATLTRELAGARAQLEKLAQFIMAEVPGEPSPSRGAVDTAIHWMTGAIVIMRTKQEQLASLESDLADARAQVERLESERTEHRKEYAERCKEAREATRDLGRAQAQMEAKSAVLRNSEEALRIARTTLCAIGKLARVNAAIDAAHQWLAALPASDAPETDAPDAAGLYHDRPHVEPGGEREATVGRDVCKKPMRLRHRDGSEATWTCPMPKGHKGKCPTAPVRAVYEAMAAWDALNAQDSGGASRSADAAHGDTAGAAPSGSALSSSAQPVAPAGDLDDTADPGGHDTIATLADVRRLVAEAEGRAVERALLRFADKLAGDEAFNREWGAPPCSLPDHLVRLLRAAATNGGSK